MDFISNMKRLYKLHKRIEKGRTGGRAQLAREMKMNPVTLSKKFYELEELGAMVKFDKIMNSYYYTNNFKWDLTISFEDETEES